MVKVKGTTTPGGTGGGLAPDTQRDIGCRQQIVQAGVVLAKPAFRQRTAQLGRRRVPGIV